ncbi:uncharacterized protein LOC122647388 [Telopea speciosissima]|uniref:uncharacterized protein LOC122647388 n=1 Tax=Telopea speciosissima TaxID=54955 RepID=UPI001CC62678|nr:uncharacterized protein LOC122647388 [Telopea speciosissima]
MALFSFCPSPVSSLTIRQPYSIPKISIAETLSSITIVHNTLGVSVYAHVTRCSALQSFRCCTNSDSSVEGEKSHSTRIFIKGLSPSTSEGFLSRTFSQFGKVSKGSFSTHLVNNVTLSFVAC